MVCSTAWPRQHHHTLQGLTTPAEPHATEPVNTSTTTHYWTWQPQEHHTLQGLTPAAEPHATPPVAPTATPSAPTQRCTFLLLCHTFCSSSSLSVSLSLSVSPCLGLSLFPNVSWVLWVLTCIIRGGRVPCALWVLCTVSNVFVRWCIHIIFKG